MKKSDRSICPIDSIIMSKRYICYQLEVEMDLNIVTYLACICFIFIIGRIFIVPLKKIFKLIMNSIIGGFVIYVINLIGANFGFHIGLNIINSLIIGLLGLPGLICLIIVKLLIG